MVQGVGGDNRDSVEKTGQNRTFPDIGVMQITDGGYDEEDRLKAKLRTGTLNVDSERAIHLSGQRRKKVLLRGECLVCPVG